MEVVYIKELDNKRMYINRKYKGIFEDKNYEVIYLDKGNMNSDIFYSENYYKVKLDVGEPDYSLLYDNKWLSTHPNGLLSITYPLGETERTVGSYAVDEKRRYYTAWHVGMIYRTTKYKILNVPVKLYHGEIFTRVRFKPSVYTPSAWARKEDLYQLEYDTIKIIPSSYQSLMTVPPGKLLGVVSMMMIGEKGIITACSKIPGVKVSKDAKIEIIGYSTGRTLGEVISARAESVVEIDKNLSLLIKNLFTTTNETMPGDSGGGCYLI